MYTVINRNDTVVFVAAAVVLQVPGGLLTFPSAARVAAEPLGVVLVVSAWNYPFCT
jgi:acyl-CoA reductase-like NAD-dependent aldehyde dehydrogenase